MSKVFVHCGVTLDGFMAGTNRGPQNPMGGKAPVIHGWIFEQRAFREHLGLPGEGATGPDNDAVAHTFDRIGANIMGKRMFDEGEASWPERAPFGCPVFVHTHETRTPWERPGGTTFIFTNESLERVLARAREAAGAKDVRISGGANVVVQYLNAGLVDELCVDVTPVFLGEGLRLFEGIDPKRVDLQVVEARHSPKVTHLRYAVTKR